jgi:hypothetical protein
MMLHPTQGVAQVTFSEIGGLCSVLAGLLHLGLWKPAVDPLRTGRVSGEVVSHHEHAERYNLLSALPGDSS